MPARYKLSYASPAGVPLVDNLQFSSLSFFRKENDVGAISARVLPIYGAAFFARDGRLELYRSVNGGPYYLEGETSFLIERARAAREEGGLEVVEISAVDMLALARRRRVAYEAGSTYTDKLGSADDLMKDVMRENFGAAALDTARDLSALLSVEANTSAGAIIADEISWKSVLDVLRNFAAASDEAGVRILFDIVKSGAQYLFRTYKSYRGGDHSAASARAVLLSQEMGNLSAPEVTVDWADEVNYIYAGGRGENDWRPIAEASTPISIAASPFARVEEFINESNIADPAKLESAAKAALALRRPRVLFSGRALDTPGLIYGLHYGYGDLVTATYSGVAFDCRVDAIKIDVDDGGERLDIRLKGERFA